MQHAPVQRTICARIPTPEGVFQLCHYVDARNQKEHLALIMGDVTAQEPVLVRVHSECFTGDVLGSKRCDCGEQLHRAMNLIAQEGAGVLLYLRQEGRGIGLEQKLRAYNLQDQGYDTVDANLMLGHQADEREYSVAAAMLHDLGVRSIRLITNNPDKIDRLTSLGVSIVARVATEPTVTRENAAYLATKAQRMRHLLSLPALANGNEAPNQTLAWQVEQHLEALQQRSQDFFQRHGRPLVTLSYAQTFDGAIGTLDGGPLQLSGPESLRITHALRAAQDAILIGIGTVLADNPQLTVRLVEGVSPQPVVVDSRLRFPRDARLLAHPNSPWIAHIAAVQPPPAWLQLPGVRFLPLPPDPEGHVDLRALLLELGRLGIRSVMAEGGARLIGSLLAQNLVDFAALTLVPRFIEGQRIPLTGLASLGLSFVNPTYIQAGQDILVWGELGPTGYPAPQPAPSSTATRPTA